MATTFRTIKSVEPRQNYRLAITWGNGPRTIVDISQFIKEGGVFAELKNVELFDKVRVGERNRTIEWPQPTDDLGYPLVDMDADSLFVMSSMQKEREHLSKVQSLIKNLGRGDKQQTPR